MSDRQERDEATFEDHLTALERAVERLESGDTPLEQSLEVYAGAVRHLAACHRVLDGAERRLELARQAAAGEEDVVPAELDDRGTVAPA